MIGLGLLVAGAPLDSRSAERAVQLAFESELVGDVEGVKQALEPRVRAANAPSEAVGRAIVERWLAGTELRAPGWASGAKRDAVLLAWDQLEGTPIELRDRAWQHLIGQHPKLQAPLGQVRLEIDRTLGLPSAVVRQSAEQALRSRDLLIGPGAVELAVRFELLKEEKVGRWNRARAELAAVLTSTSQGSTKPVASFARSRSERRVGKDAARRMVLKRLTLDAAEAIRFALRRRAIARYVPMN